MSDPAGYERWVVLLAGGIGSRFWPASRADRPKQFLPLASDRPLIVDTLERARALAPRTRLLIVSGRPLQSLLEHHIPNLQPDQLLLEPLGRGTAPALAWAAHEILARTDRPEEAVMVSLHSDHFVHPLERFVSTVERAVAAAGALDRLVTIGIPPARPETGYGYIEVGEPLADGAREIRRFVEKPDRTTAESFLDRGGYLWNSGMFVWRPRFFMTELKRHTPELAGLFPHLEAGDVDAFFENSPMLSIDHGLMERSENGAVVEAEFEWDDVGAWEALIRTRERDPDGNVRVGDVHSFDCQDSVLWAEEGPIVAVGLSGLVVARASGITFVAPLERARELK